MANLTYSMTNATLASSSSLETPFYFTAKSSVIPGISDWYLSHAASPVAYWALSMLFHGLDNSGWKWLDKYRIHESEEYKSRNRASVNEVIRAVILQQVIQVSTGLVLTAFDEEPQLSLVEHQNAMMQIAVVLMPILKAIFGERLGASLFTQYGASWAYFAYWWAIPIFKYLVAMFIIDTWQYFLHRAMHVNKWLYKNFHSVHHRLYVPYAFGALYNHPLEGFLLDTCGAIMAQAVTQMTLRQSTFLYFFSTLKTVDDHCGYKLPFDFLQLFSNTADYHDIHHQMIGIKSNFSQPFFIHWDNILGTRMTREELEQRKLKNHGKTE